MEKQVADETGDRCPTGYTTAAHGERRCNCASVGEPVDEDFWEALRAQRSILDEERAETELG